MFGFGTTELLVIAGIAVLVFGAKRLPEIGTSLGDAIREFRKVGRKISTDDEDDGASPEEGEKNSLEKKMAEKIIEDVPSVKKGLAIKKKVDKIKEIIK